MSESDQSTNTTTKQKTIYLAILFFGGFTMVLIFYLIYKYFRMRRNDIEQRRAQEEQQRIERHNQSQKERYRKKQDSLSHQNILTNSIINWTNESIVAREGACLRCSAYLNSKGSYPNLEEVKAGG
jgi:flagellar biosynthesis/type III secretory pathway M-ring protein FliF/YscJ